MTPILGRLAPNPPHLCPTLIAMNLIEKEFALMQQVLTRFAVPENFAKIEQAGQLLVRAFQNGNKVLACGNGGSMCDAMHFAEELSGQFRVGRPALPAMAISDPGYLSCVANDLGYDRVFARYIEAFGQPGDVLLAISTSGNSKNVLAAAGAAQTKNMIVIALTGRDGGKLAQSCDLELRVDYPHWADRIQEVHIKIIHCLIQHVEHAMFPMEAR